MNAVSERLGVGLYTPSEAAFYSRVPLQTLNRWFYGNEQGQLVTAPRFGENERVVTFLDFVQAMAIRNVRLNHRIPLPKIRDAIERAKDEYEVDYPLARKKTIYQFGHDIYIHLDGIRKLTGGNLDQSVMEPVVELYMRDLGFDAEGLAASYTAFDWHGRQITMNPEIRLGEPLLSTCCYSARTLWEASEAEGGIEAAAMIYGVAEEDVEAAYRYWDYLSTARAA